MEARSVTVALKTVTVVFGVILLVVGAVVAVIFGATTITGRTHQIIPAGGIALAILGGILGLLGATSKTTSQTGEFKCQFCGATFGSETAVKSHTKDKHGS